MDLWLLLDPLGVVCALWKTGCEVPVQWSLWNYAIDIGTRSLHSGQVHTFGVLFLWPGLGVMLWNCDPARQAC